MSFLLPIALPGWDVSTAAISKITSAPMARASNNWYSSAIKSLHKIKHRKHRNRPSLILLCSSEKEESVRIKRLMPHCLNILWSPQRHLHFGVSIPLEEISA